MDMKSVGTISSVTVLGTGNVASWFLFVLKKANISIRQIYGRNELKCKQLAEQYQAVPISDLRQLDGESDLYLFSLKDEVYSEVVEKIPFQLPAAVLTAGSVSQNVLSPVTKRFGVLYPCQTISSGMDFSKVDVPLCVEGVDSEMADSLLFLAKKLSENSALVSEEQRAKLHLAAVFASNFSNAMCGIAFDMLEKEQIDPRMLLPILQNTVEKLKLFSPWQSQTGPARRQDQQVMNRHLNLMQDTDLQDIYKLISNYIIKKTSPHS